ncbi:YhjR family protein [Myxococcota bacterium]|nr:YhjR family protein [Myxococcota bacterium]
MTDDVQRLLQAAAGPDFEYRETRRHEEATAAARRWPLVEAAVALVARTRRAPRRAVIATPSVALPFDRVIPPDGTDGVELRARPRALEQET